MGYIPLRDVLNQVSDPKAVARMAYDICRCLEAYHSNNQLHADIRPQSIFLEDTGAFCLAEPADAPVSAFCAPEVRRGQNGGFDSDLYSLGTVMHWLLNGRRMSGTPLEAPVYGDDGLNAIIEKACAIDPRSRYQSAQEMLSDLHHYLSPKKKSSALVPAVIVGILAAVLATVIAIILLSGEKPKPVTPEDYTLPHAHIWSDATCIAPKTCDTCGEEQGEALGHDWLPGSCETPDTCSRCDAVRGESSGHKWMEATFDYPEYCENCGVTRGEALPMPLTWLPHISDTNSPGSDKDVTIGDWDDPHGIVREHTIRFWLVEREGYHNSESTVYELSGQYRTINASAFLTDGTEPGGSAYVRVWGDGVMLAQSETVTEGNIIYICADISGVKELTVECVTNSSSFTYCVVDAHINK